MISHRKNKISRLKRGAILGLIGAVVTFFIILIFRNNLTLGVFIASLVIITLWLFLVRKLLR